MNACAVKGLLTNRLGIRVQTNSYQATGRVGETIATRSSIARVPRLLVGKSESQPERN
jgi:hypothetical protein